MDLIHATGCLAAVIKYLDVSIALTCSIRVLIFGAVFDNLVDIALCVYEQVICCLLLLKCVFSVPFSALLSSVKSRFICSWFMACLKNPSKCLNLQKNSRPLKVLENL